MKTKLFFLATLTVMCTVIFQVNAQTPNIEKLFKEIEAKAKQADKHPKDGKMQLNVALSLLSDSLGEKRDFDRALTYANRALKIAQERPAPQDTLLGLTCETLGTIYMRKQDMEKSADFLERAMDAYEVELGRLDPVTNGSKLVYGCMMALTQPSRGFPKILEAMSDNSRTPQDKRIQNMDEANIALELLLEMLMIEQTERFNHALPVVFIDGKRYFMLDTGFWNMEHPLVGWLLQGMTPSDTKDDAAKDDDTILLGDDGTFMVLTDADDEKRQLLFNFQYKRENPNQLEFNEGEARILSLNDDAYNQILAKYREFKSKR